MRITMIITVDNFYHYVPTAAWPLFSVMVGMMTNNDNNDKINHDCGNDYKYDNNCQYYWLTVS